MLIPPIGIFAALIYYQNGYVRFPVVGLIALGFVLGALIGAKLVPHVSPAMLKIGLGLIMLYLGFFFVFNPSGGTGSAALPAGLAALFAAVVSRLLGRTINPQNLPPPQDDHNYHI